MSTSTNRVYTYGGGIVKEKPLKNLAEKDKVRIEEEEKDFLSLMGWTAFLPFRRPKLPEDFRRSWYTGKPLHKDRFDRILQPGMYFHLPVLDEIVAESKQERVYNLGNITVPTTDEDSRSMQISCDLRRRGFGLLQNLHCCS